MGSFDARAVVNLRSHSLAKSAYCIFGKSFGSHKARESEENNINETIHMPSEVSVCSVKELLLVERSSLKKKKSHCFLFLRLLCCSALSVCIRFMLLGITASLS